MKLRDISCELSVCSIKIFLKISKCTSWPSFMSLPLMKLSLFIFLIKVGGNLLNDSFILNENIKYTEVSSTLLVSQSSGVSKNADVTFNGGKYFPLGMGRLIDHGNHVLTTPNIYIIFYGNGYWNSDETEPYITFSKYLGKSNYIRNSIEQLGAGVMEYKSSIIVNGGSSTDDVSNGRKSAHICMKEINGGSFGPDPDPQGIYILVTDPYKSKNLGLSRVSKYSESWCGYHTFGVFEGKHIVFGIVGTGEGVVARGCRWNLESQYTSSPTNNLYVDFSISVLGHEIVEAATDPYFNKWYDKAGYEVADKCNAWPGAANKSPMVGFVTPLYNAIIGNTKYLLQTHYDNEKNTCPEVIW
jgi:hypothetical protein